MLLLIYIDTISCAEASFHPIPAAVTKGVQPDPKLNHNDNVYQHTQTHKYIKRCAKRAAVLLTAAAPLSTPKSPPSQLPTPLPAANLRLNKLTAVSAQRGAVRLQPPRLKMARIFLRWCSARRCVSSKLSSCASRHCASATSEDGTMAMHAMPIGELWRASCQSRLARPAAHAQALLLRWKAHGTPMPRIGRQPIHANLGHTSSKSSAHHRGAAAARRERGVGNGPPGLRPGGRTTDWGGKALTAGGGCATLRQSPARGVAQRRPRIGVLLHLRWRKLERQLPVNNDKEEGWRMGPMPSKQWTGAGSGWVIPTFTRAHAP